MDFDSQLPWTYDLDQAIHLQETLRHRLILAWEDRPINTLAGVDVSYREGMVHSAISVYSYPDLTLQHTFTAEAPQDFPYIAGLLAYRVGPAILAAWEKLALKPDLLLVHAHGIAHPRRLGLASHLGLWLNLPTIGVAKTLLYGCQSEPGPQAGLWSSLTDEHHSKQVIGAVLRTLTGARPIYVSPGHLIDLQHSITFVLETCRAARLPEPIRTAHAAAAHSL